MPVKGTRLMVQRKVIVRGATDQALDELDAADIPDLSAAYEATGAVATHAGLADPHTGYQKEAEKSAASGYASLDVGTKVPIAELPTGTLGTTGDTSRVTFTQAAAGTSVTDTAVWDISAVMRSIGAAGVMHGSLQMAHVLAVTGFSTLGHNVMQVASAGFDTTVASLIVGMTFNHGTAGAGNIEQVTAELVNG